MLTPEQLQTIKAVLFMRLMAERGGEWVLTFAEVEAIGQEFDGWSIHLQASENGMRLRVQSPKVPA